MFDKRLQLLKQKIIKQNLDAVLISTTSNIMYLTGYANFSEIEREAYLIIGKNFQYLITDGRYAEAIKKQVPHFTLFERGYKNSTEDLLKKMKDKIEILAIEEDNLTVAEYRLIQKYFKIKHFEVGQHRSIKIADEIEKIQKACKIGDLAYEYILKNIKLGQSEKQVDKILESFVRDAGGLFSFPAIVAFGKNSSIPHHHTGEDKLKGKGEFVLLDFGVRVENYCSDMTRTIFFGTPSNKQVKIYQTVLAAQNKAIEFLNQNIKKGNSIKANVVDEVARKYILSKGFPNIPHSLGHGIGLQVHEHPHLSPKSNEILKEGMVFSIEPGIYIQGFGGVRIEDLYVYGKNGLRQITTSTKNLVILN